MIIFEEDNAKFLGPKDSLYDVYHSDNEHFGNENL